MNDSGLNRPAGTKKELRSRLLAARDALPQQVRKSASAEACRHAAEWIASQDFKRVMAYASFRTELDTASLLGRCWAEGRTVLLPKVRKEDGSMSVYRVQSWDELIPGAFGILEPDPDKAEPAADIIPQAVFVPGAGFDRYGGRIGYGGGYYDRYRAAFAAQHEFIPLWIGLGYSSQLISNIPMEPHDTVLDGLITELGLIWTQSQVKGESE